MKVVTKVAMSLALTSSLTFAATLATVNGTKITDEEVNNVLMQATQGRFNQLPPQQQQQFKQKVLDQLITQEVIYNDAQKKGITKSAEYKKEVARITKDIKKRLAIQMWQKKVFDGIKVSNKELKDYYKKNKQEFMQKESVHARHILVKTKAEAEAIIKQLKGLHGTALKQKFIELAKAKSVGPSGKNGGDLGYFPKGRMVPEFEKKAFSMKVGSVSSTPVKTQFGYHVIYIEDKQKASLRPFSEVKPFIEQRLKMEKFKKVMDSKINTLKKHAHIKK